MKLERGFIAMRKNEQELEEKLSRILSHEFTASPNRLDNMRRKLLADIPNENISSSKFILPLLGKLSIGLALLILLWSIFTYNADKFIMPDKTNQKNFVALLEDDQQLDLVLAVLGDFTGETNVDPLEELYREDNTWILFEDSENGESLYDL